MENPASYDGQPFRINYMLRTIHRSRAFFSATEVPYCALLYFMHC